MPEAVAADLIRAARERLGPGIDVEKHFTRAIARGSSASRSFPDGDFFEPFKSGKASIVTDEIERFTARGCG